MTMFATRVPDQKDWYGRRKVVDPGSYDARNAANNSAVVDNWAWDNTQRNWAIEDRQNSQDMASDANKFMQEWLGDLGTVENMYTQSFDSAKKMQSTADTMEKQWKDYGAKWGSTQDTLMKQGLEDLDTRNKFGVQFQEAAKADYEGVKRQAAADVTQQSNQGREAMMRQMSGMGINPNSGRYAGGMRSSYLDEAKNAAMAMNAASANEKNRTAGMAATGMQLYDPSKTLGLAMNIQQGQNSLANSVAGLNSAAASTMNAAASGLAQNVAAPKGELAGTFTGLVAKNGGNPLSPSRSAYRQVARSGQYGY